MLFKESTLLILLKATEVGRDGKLRCFTLSLLLSQEDKSTDTLPSKAEENLFVVHGTKKSTDSIPGHKRGYGPNILQGEGCGWWQM